MEALKTQSFLQLVSERQMAIFMNQWKIHLFGFKQFECKSFKQLDFNLNMILKKKILLIARTMFKLLAFKQRYRTFLSPASTEM